MLLTFSRHNSNSTTCNSIIVRSGLVLIVILSSVVTGQTCPPPGFDALQDFDLNGYIEKRWYSIKQIVVPYQPRTQFYCVYAQYAKRKYKSLYCI